MHQARGDVDPQRVWAHWIGRSTSATAFLDPAVANHLAATLDHDARFEVGDPIPPAWHWLYFTDLATVDDVGPPGGPSCLRTALPPLGLPHRLWAGGRLHFAKPVRLGDTVTRTSTIASIVRNRGSAGPQCFLTIEHELAADAVSCIRESQVLVYWESSDAASRGPASAPPASDFQARYEPTASVPFRYSAVTFNSHRVHHDLGDVKDEEAFPQGVVHPPLVAMLLMDLAQRGGGRLMEFSFSVISPLLLSYPFTTHRNDCRGHTADLWTASHDGSVAMKATATYVQERCTPT